MLIKQLAWEGFNVPIHNAVEAIRNDMQKWVVTTHDLDTGVGPIIALTVSIKALVKECVYMTHPPHDVHLNHTYWDCGKTDHLRWFCP